MKHFLVAIDVDCIPISKALKGQLTLDISYEIKKSTRLPGSQEDKERLVPVDGLGWRQASVAGSAHYSVLMGVFQLSSPTLQVHNSSPSPPSFSATKAVVTQKL